MSTITLRLRLPTGQQTISVASTDSLSSLLALISAAADAPAEGLTVKSGFPPRPLALEGDAPISSVLQSGETLDVAGVPIAAAAPPSKKAGRGRGGGARGRGSAAAPSSSPAVNRGGGGAASVATLSDVSGGSATSARKRPASAVGGGGGKRRATGALQLGSEEGIGASLLGAVSSKGGSAALHREDPAAAFLKAAASSALAHHVEEVHANERFQAALSGTVVFTESDVERRADGEATQCVASFKVGRANRVESFALLSRPELRAVLQEVIASFHADRAEDEDDDDDGRPVSMELLKPFKMAHASPRVFWNLAREFGGDIARGLRELQPQVDWSYLDERERKRSGKAAANAAQTTLAEREKAERAAKRREKAAAKAAAAAAAAGEAVNEPMEPIDVDVDAKEAEVAVPAQVPPVEDNEDGDLEQSVEEVSEPADDDADAWEELGRRAMLKDQEYDYACICLNKALQIRIVRLGGRDAADASATMAEPWYLHGSALLRRAQALHLTLTTAEPSPGEAGPAVGTSAADTATGAASLVADARDALGAEWQTTGSAAIGRRVRRFFALSGMSDGTVIAWQPPVEPSGREGGEGEDDDGSEGEEALYRILMDDGDEEDLEEEELEDAMRACSEGRSVAGEVEELLEAAWEALEMAAMLYDVSPAHPLGKAEAHERLGDCANQNEQPERALEEYSQARDILGQLRESSELQAEDRRISDVEWSLGMTYLQLGRGVEAISHYRQAARTLELRAAILERRAQDRKISRLSRATTGAVDADGVEEGAAPESEGTEVAEIAELVRDIEKRIQQVQAAL